MGNKEQIYIIAEIGGNHNGEFQKAVEMISVAKACGVDAAKFQIYVPEKLVHKAQKPHPILMNKYKSQLDRYKSLYFLDEQVVELKRICDEVDIEFLATPFDLDSADLIDPLVQRYKVASGDIDNIILLNHLFKKNKPLIISTGMASLDEIESVYDLAPNKKMITFLHCVSLYPTSPEKSNLKTIPFLKSKFAETTIGYSDHTEGIIACIGAVALGATVIEKHFTFDKTIPFGDHKLSADYSDMEVLVKQIRQLERMLGKVAINRTDEELEKRAFFRRGLYAVRDISKGTKIQLDDIKLVRPPTEIKANQIYKAINRTATRSILKDDPIMWKDID